MKIEVACHLDDSTKQKGDLLENLSKKLLEAQGYSVIQEIRFTAIELDLLCKHKVSGKEIYVECKAHKEKISAPILTQLLGTVQLRDYAEGWLISASEFGKEAKGFVETWKEKPKALASILSFYTPELIIDSLISASIIKSPPIEAAAIFVDGIEFLGDWLLLVTNYGMFWSVYTLKGGAPHGVLLYNAQNSRQINDKATLENISNLESSVKEFDLFAGVLKDQDNYDSALLPTVIEVQTGDSWDDYRPSRPQDFVGRDDLQKNILSFLESAKETNGSRVFAITGNSGLGKSSLIAKLRDRSRNVHYKNKHFVFAVDIRGARTTAYILSSLISCLRKAQENNFGDRVELKITDPNAPLTSPEISKYMDSLDRKGQVVCLVFDQFEELYSKPELFGIFKAAKDLMLDVAGSKRNLVLGFAWKTDSTTQQDHPAYHMWHELADHRKEYRLNVFDSGEISKSITKFEKEVIGHKLAVETRHQIKYSSQGFPWLLKKLLINLHEEVNKGEVNESVLVDFDVARLFDADIDALNSSEHTCLKLVAQKAPADWSEIIESSGIVVLNSLVNKRLVIKSGDRLNIYWDIFKDYLLTKKVPFIPYNYIPTANPSSLLKVCEILTSDSYQEASVLSDQLGLSKRTIWNIGADLVILGLAERKGSFFKLHKSLNIYSEQNALKLLRSKLDKHSLKIELFKKYAGKNIRQDEIRNTLFSILPREKYDEKTWSIYTNRLINYLIYSGFLGRVGQFLIVQDLGAPPLSNKSSLYRRGGKRSAVFSISVSPYATVEALELIDRGLNDPKLISRNALIVLKRFELVSISDEVIKINKESIQKYGGYAEAVWTIAKNERSITKAIDIITKTQPITLKSLGIQISEEYKLNWSEGSIKRNGGILYQWSSWIIDGIIFSSIPTPPGRSNSIIKQDTSEPQFELPSC